MLNTSSKIKQVAIDLLPERIYLEIRQRDYIRTHRSEYENWQKLRQADVSYPYSLKPFDQTKSIFVHIPKCAGVSVNRALFNTLGGGHKTFDKYLCIFEPECILDYFKFSIVRNPWDRLVSAYSFLANGGFNQEDKDFFDQNLSSFSGFDEFVKKWLNDENILQYKHFRPQNIYILDKRNKVNLDFLAFFENIQDDFEYIRKRIGTEKRLSSSNRSKHGHYTDYYTPETRDIVAKVYKEDIDLLGYTFDNSSLDSQLKSRNVPAMP